ncbi:hypothetical protein H0H92_009065 [Tricholoma furcatifolium]|nr:hypothetical protein H0H92_009065 [Tricholoma furcatifolium]
MLPFSSRIATVAGDCQIRVFDIGEAALSSAINGKDPEQSYSTQQALAYQLRCHDDRVKRIVTEYSPDLFLTVGEDGTVRQHDLRTPHDCRRNPCPAPLIKLNHQLSTLALSPLTPHLFVVAGDSPHGYLFDRRHVGRNLRTEWGIPDNIDAGPSLTTCVRRFASPKRPDSGSISGARMSAFNGHELSLHRLCNTDVTRTVAFSGDAVYLYSTYDDPDQEGTPSPLASPPPPPSNAKRRRLSSPKVEKKTEPDSGDSMDIDPEPSSSSSTQELDSNLSQHNSGSEAESDDDDDATAGDDDDDDEENYLILEDILLSADNRPEDSFVSRVPVVLPRQLYSGARNVRTTKDVNFLGPNDEYVASGSDDGNFFIWRKETGALHGIYEGDGSVVNMIEGHPFLPLIAVSGIDYTVKLFAPSNTNSPSKFSRIANAANIMKTNSRRRPPTASISSFARLLAQARWQVAMDDGDGEECRNQ